MEVSVIKALEPWSQLTGHNREVLKAPPLVLALCQVNFATKLRATTDEVAGAFQDKVDARYPLLNPIEMQSFEFSGTAGQSPQARNLPGKTILQFADHASDWVVSLSSDSIALECRSYQHFEEFLDRLQEVLDACIATVRPTVVNRIGLRYINEIRLTSITDVSTVVRSELLGPLSEPIFQVSTKNALQSFELATQSRARINFNHGYFPSGTTIQLRPNESSQSNPFYLIDLDVYQVFAGNDEMAMNSKGLVDRASEFHDTLSRIFWWAITHDFVTKSKGS